MRQVLTRRLAKAAVICVALVAAPLAAQAESLAGALASAYRNSGLLEQNRAVLRAADEDVATAVSLLRPVVDFTTSVGRSYSDTRSTAAVITTGTSTLSLSVTLSLLVFDNGVARFSEQAAKETVLATRAALLGVEQDVLLRAVAAYMNVIRETQTVALRENNVRVITQELRAAQDRFEVGEVTRTDVALAESRLAEARANLAAAQGNLLNQQEEYLAAVGRRPGTLSPPPGLPTPPESIEAAKAVALRNHPSVIQLQHAVAAAELAVLRAEAGMGPTVRLNGSLGVTDNLGNTATTNSSSLSLVLSQRIYQGGALASGLRKAMAQRDSSRAQLMTVQEAVAQAASNAFVRLEVARATIEATDRRIAAAQVAFRGVREEAALGARTTLDVLDAEQELLDAQGARISAQAELYVAAYQLLSAQGLLSAQRLGLGVQVYDPTAYYNMVKDAPAHRSERGRKLDRVLRSLNKD